MGLDAVVYVNQKNLPMSLDRENLEVDPLTGEVYFSDDEIASRHPTEIFTAIHRRLGNVNLLAEVLASVSHVVKSDSILRGKVLKSFSHSGDIIPYDDLDALANEIRLIKDQNRESGSSALEEFFEDLSQLVRTAKQEQNPIVFV
jgi:hypothetical protein